MIFSFSNLSYGQEPCSAGHIHQKLLNTNPAYKARVIKNEQQLQEQLHVVSNGRNRSGNDTIPVVVHVLHTGQAVGVGVNISDAQIQSSIDRLNEVFADYDGGGTDTGIRFALAKRDPDGCTSSTGINRVDATGVEDYENVGILTDNSRVNLFDLSRWNTEEYLNFWVVSEINDNNASGGTLGFATMSATSHWHDGVVCLYNTVGYDPAGTEGYSLDTDQDENEVVIHEVGHYLELYHTFQGDNDGFTCPTDADCGTHGDCCGDTDPHIRTFSNVCYSGLNNSCTGSNYGEVVQNYMAYSSQGCKDRFTDDQVARMQAVLLAGRTGLLTSPGLVDVDGSEPATACAATTGAGSIGNYGVGPIKIEIGTWATESGNAYEDGGYVDNWCNQIRLEPNTTYNYNITTAGNYSEWLGAWIDYNNDGTFTNASEMIITPGAYGTSFTGSFTTPANMVYNSNLRMRIRSSAASNTTDPCYNPIYSQAEDYSVYFENNAAFTASESSFTNIRAVTCCESDASTFTLSADDLLNDVTVSLGSTDFEISSDGTNYYSSFNLTETSGNIENQPVTLYVRLKAGLAIGDYNDQITITSSPATDVIIPVSGAVGETDGVRGNAFYVASAGSHFAVANDFKGITGTDSRTYEAWIKTSTEDVIILANGTNSTGQKWVFRVQGGKLRIETNGANLVGSTDLDDGQWHHVAVVLDSSVSADLDHTTLYVDGFAETISSSGSTSNSINTASTQNLWIGTDHNNRTFEGYLDEVRVWSAARTQANLRELMHMTLTGNEAGLEAYYQFNETSGTTTYDVVNGHDITLNGSVSLATSTLDVGSGSFSTVSIGGTGDGSVEVNSNGLEIDFTDGGTMPNGDLVIFQIEDTPANGHGKDHEATRHWVVRNFGTNQTGLNLESIQLTVSDTDPILTYEANSMSLHKRASGSDGAWTEVSSEASSVNDTNGEIFFNSLTDFTSFSQLSIGSVGFALPVEFASFTASRLDDIWVDLQWTTASEQFNRNFEIERSYDGEQFERIGSILSQGNSTATQRYQTKVRESKSAYYRLRQVDYDGTNTLSAIRYVEGSSTIDVFNLYPNPTMNEVRLYSSQSPDTIIELEVFGIDSRKLIHIKGELTELNEVLVQEVPQFQAGIYMVRVTAGRDVSTLKLVVNDR